MALRKRQPVTDIATSIQLSNGIFGSFVCEDGSPFNISNFPGKIGALVYFSSKDGNNPVVASATVNGVAGATFVREYPPGAGMPVEVEALTMSSGIATIYLLPLQDNH